MLAINLNKEVIVVNDGSTDDSLTKLNEFKDRIVLINLKENTGVSNARNIGIEKSIGDYISFIDIDDDFESNMHEILLNHMIKNNADLCISNNDFIEINGDRIKPHYNNNFNNLGKIDVLKKYLIGEIYPSVWSSIFRSSVVKEIRFNDKLRIGEDILFLLRYLIRSQKTTFITDSLYHYVQNNLSSIHFLSDKLVDYLLIPSFLLKNEIKILMQSCPDEFEYFRMSMIYRSINAISFATTNNNFCDAVSLINKNFNRSDFKKVISSVYTPKYIKLEFFILKNIGVKFHLKVFPFYRKIRNIKRRRK